LFFVNLKGVKSLAVASGDCRVDRAGRRGYIPIFPPGGDFPEEGVSSGNPRRDGVAEYKLYLSTMIEKKPYGSDIEAFLARVLPLVSKPGRYIGGEVNSRRGSPSSGDLRVCLAFPEVYEIGMSHQGTAIILDILNRTDGVFAERAFAVWPDMEDEMRRAGVPLFSLETRTPLARFDIIGFSLMYEMTYTNVVAMLDLAGIPVMSADRDERFPLIIAGGACAFNPEPVAEIFDAIVVGDGEEVITEIVEIRREMGGAPRGDLLARLAEIDGVYVPRFYEPEYRDGAFFRMNVRTGFPRSVKKRLVGDLNSTTGPEKPIVPHVRAVHDRISVEIARGCRRGCRFCQAGYTYRPVRERDPGAIEEIVGSRHRATGMEEVSLLSLSSGDYSAIEPLMGRLMGTLAEKRVALSVPSLRVDTLTDEMIAQIKRVRKTGFTVAPEAGSERLRAVINKNITEAEIEATVDRVFKAGWRLIKLYFMIGLPTETDEDIEAIVRLIGNMERRISGRGRAAMNVSVSTFIPKPHTPFQWEGMADYAEIGRRQEIIRRSLRSGRITLRFHDRRMSMLEAVFSRGDRRLCQVIIRAARLGCRFDGWTDHLRFDLWEQAFGDLGLTMERYIAWTPSVGAPLPWGHIETGVTGQFLARERERALAGGATASCVPEGCADCGVCDAPAEDIGSVKSTAAAVEEPTDDVDAPSGTDGRLKYLFCYSRTGLVRFLSHLDIASAFERALSRADVPVNFSEGFHPKPRISFSGALAVGVEARREPFVVELSGHIDTDAAAGRLNETLPEGIRIDSIIAPSDRPETRAVRRDDCVYRVGIPENGYRGRDMTALIQSFLDKTECWYEGVVKGQNKRINVRPFIDDIRYEGPEGLLVVMRRIGGSSPSPYRVISTLFGIEEHEARSFMVVKEASAVSVGAEIESQN
jgi:radical SAM family uncharacterized protein/radical SAM-linked protein